MEQNTGGGFELAIVREVAASIATPGILLMAVVVLYLVHPAILHHSMEPATNQSVLIWTGLTQPMRPRIMFTLAHLLTHPMLEQSPRAVITYLR